MEAFDLTSPIWVSVMDEKTGDVREVAMTYPSTQDWIDHYRSTARIVLRQDGNSASLDKPEEKIEVAAKILDRNKIDPEKWPQLTPEQAAMVIDVLASASIVEMDREGLLYRMKLVTYLGQVTLLLKIPPAAQVRKNYTKITPLGRRGKFMIATDHQALSGLFDELYSPSCPAELRYPDEDGTDYTLEAVPFNLKVFAASQLIEEIESIYKSRPTIS